MDHLQSLDLTELDWTGVLSSPVQSASTAHQSNSVIIDGLCNGTHYIFTGDVKFGYALPVHCTSAMKEVLYYAGLDLLLGLIVSDVLE